MIYKLILEVIYYYGEIYKCNTSVNFISIGQEVVTKDTSTRLIG